MASEGAERAKMQLICVKVAFSDVELCWAQHLKILIKLLEKNERYCQIMKRDCCIEHPTEKSSTAGEEVSRKVSTERVKDYFTKWLHVRISL